MVGGRASVACSEKLMHVHTWIRGLAIARGGGQMMSPREFDLLLETLAAGWKIWNSACFSGHLRD